MVQQLIIEITKSKKNPLDGIKWVMRFINKTRIVQNAVLVPNPKRKKNQNVVVFVSVSAFSDNKTGISIMIPSYPPILRKEALKYFTEIESECSTVPLTKPTKLVTKSLAKQFSVKRTGMCIHILD